jgi:hypothetical protein
MAVSLTGVAMGRECEAYALAVDLNGAVVYPDDHDPAQFDFWSLAVVQAVNLVN